MISSLVLGAALTALAPAGAEPAQQSRVAPRGSYAQSCSGAYVNGGRLYADCLDMRGQRQGTSIDLARCTNDEIHNDNGLLICGTVRGDREGRPGGGGRPGGNDGGWNGGGGRPGNGGGNGDGGWNPGGGRPGNGGGWGDRRVSITFHRDPDFRGASQTFTGEVTNLGYTSMNDAASALSIRGEWEVCTDANFRGRCEIVRDDVRNLRRIGMDDRISSARPVGRGGGRW
jgi:hypothetical protein